ncbi:unnamed protein product [Anisakis simplex]|uniref:Putative nudix hydrolase 7 (inferred by orthology to a C. elegans protein) n=1 Tax=Anisakis simplex TaxID=6269 RepID=A0A0M3JZW8_ANISI|nr:unnamed protein product [Anisakis simplex]
MGRRCSRSSFLPNAFVFPGGMVDDTDKAMPNWLTPFDYGKRFDTYFYTLDVSDNSDKEAIKIDSKSKELYEIDWYSAEEIVNRANSGQLILPPPQAYEIRRIIENRFGNLEQLYCPLKLCPQLLDAGDKVIALLNNDFAYNHDQNSTETPMRKACSADLPSAIGTSTVNEGKTRRQLHRMIFNKKPLWSQMKVIYCSTQQSQQQR